MKPQLEAIHPVLMSNNVFASIQFYERIGFSLTFQDDPVDPKYAVLERDHVSLHLRWQDANQWAYPIDRPTYRFYVRNVDVLHEEFREKGALTPRSSGGPWQAPANTPWGTREFHVRDPDGNGLQFYRGL